MPDDHKPKRYRQPDPPGPQPARELAEKHHALFRPPQGAFFPAEKIERIYVARVLASGELEQAPGWFAPDDLDDLEAIRARFGGGVYDLMAIRPDGTTYRHTRTPKLSGAPRALVPPDEIPAEARPAAPAPAAPSVDPMLGLFQLMFAESRAASERTMQLLVQMQNQAIAMQQQQTQLLVSALNGQKVDTGALVASVADVFAKASPAAPQTSPVTQAKEVLELAKAIPAPKEETVGEIVGAIGQAMGAMAAMGAAGAANGPAAAAPKPPVLPPTMPRAPG